MQNSDSDKSSPNTNPVPSVPSSGRFPNNPPYPTATGTAQPADSATKSKAFTSTTPLNKFQQSQNPFVKKKGGSSMPTPNITSEVNLDTTNFTEPTSPSYVVSEENAKPYRTKNYLVLKIIAFVTVAILGFGGSFFYFFITGNASADNMTAPAVKNAATNNTNPSPSPLPQPTKTSVTPSPKSSNPFAESTKSGEIANPFDDYENPFTEATISGKKETEPYVNPFSE